MKPITLFGLGAMVLFSFSACHNKTSVDLIVHHAQVYTVDSAFSIEEAFAIKDGKFVDIGENEVILNQYEAPEIVDAKGAFLYPGFYDAHCHFFELAQKMHQVDLVGVKSEDELIDRVKEFRAKYPDDAWIVGHGWDQNRWVKKTFPSNEILNHLFPNTPVYLRRIDGHAALVNEAAFKRAQVNTEKQPLGGIIEHKQGKATGILIDNAMDLVQLKIPAPSERELTDRLQAAEKLSISTGLTTVVDAGLSFEELDFLKKLYGEDKLHIREYAMIMLNDHNLKQILAYQPYVGDKLTIQSVKISADGALGSRGACLLEPYQDAPTSGFLTLAPAYLDSAIAKLSNSRLQVNVHAIGDSTNRFILHTFNKHLKTSDRRWRIEHAQLVTPPDFELFSEKGIIPSIQPTHATSDMFWAVDRLGAKRLKEEGYAYKKLLSVAGKVALGSDFPVEEVGPILQFHAAVARTDSEGKPEGGFQMENALTREEALKGLTIWAAYACFQDHKKGSIEKGKEADFVWLKEDLMHAPLTAIREIQVQQTWIDGKQVYTRIQSE